VRNYYLDKSTTANDNDHMLADLRSRFYADYVPLLLHATWEHARVGLLELFNLKDTVKDIRPKSFALRQTRKAFELHQPQSPITKALLDFENSDARNSVQRYRDDWVHDKPPRVESIFYNPPRESYVRFKDETFPWDSALIGAELPPPDYSWDILVIMLKDALRPTIAFLTACADEWEQQIQQS
jgi:hypothetical protein